LVSFFLRLSIDRWTGAAPYTVPNKPIQTWGKQYPNKEVSHKMAESGCGVMSNSVNTQNQVSAVQRISQTEESDKTDQVLENGPLEPLPLPEATSSGTTGKIPDLSKCNGDTGE
jgi:hypothetical protein